MKFIAFSVIAAFLLFCRKSGEPLKAAAMGFITGGSALLAAFFILPLFGISVPVNIFTAAMSLCAGVPFVVFLVIYSVK